MSNAVELRAAIRVRFHGPTNVTGSRLSVKDSAEYSTRRIFVEYDHSSPHPHADAAREWCDRFLDQPVKLYPIGFVFGNDYYFSWELDV